MLNHRTTQITLSAIALISLLGTTSTTNANGHLNCQAYAQSAINQTHEAAKWGCGFSGPAWTTDYNQHFSWCNNNAQMADLTREDRNRKAAIQQCKITKPGSGIRPANAYDEKGCQNYANQMIFNAQKNINQECGINDPRMHQNYQAHFDWCFNGRTKKQVRDTLNQVIASVSQCN